MKKIASGVAALLSGLFLLALPFIIIFGLAQVGIMISPWLTPVFCLTLLVSVFVLGPLAVIRKARGFSAVCFFVASYVFGTCLWFSSLILTGQLWGMIGVILGLIVVGIGIVPVALLATLVNGQWYSAVDLVILCSATFGARLLAVWLSQKAEQDRRAEIDPQRSRPRTQQHSWIISLGILGTVGLLIFVCCLVSSPKAKLSAAEVFSQTSRSVVRIEVHCRNGTEMVGSGS